MKILCIQLLPHVLPALGRGLSSSVGALIMAQDRHSCRVASGMGAADGGNTRLSLTSCVVSAVDGRTVSGHYPLYTCVQIGIISRVRGHTDIGFC